MHGDYYLSPLLLEGVGQQSSWTLSNSVDSISLCLSIYLSVCPRDAAFLARTVIIKLTRRRREGIGGEGIGEGEIRVGGFEWIFFSLTKETFRFHSASCLTLPWIFSQTRNFRGLFWCIMNLSGAAQRHVLRVNEPKRTGCEQRDPTLLVLYSICRINISSQTSWNSYRGIFYRGAPLIWKKTFYFGWCKYI